MSFHTAGAYTEFRPTYPKELFARLAGLCREHDCAWDCAAGSGQAAAGLAALFSQVIATDASCRQIAHASDLGNVDFRVAPAEASGLANHSVELVTVAQAAHWFELPRFYAEVRRVLESGGAIALWGYGRLGWPEGMAEIL